MCRKIDLFLRLVFKVLTIASGTEDGWAHPSLRLLAEQLDSKPGAVSELVQTRKFLDLFDVRQEPGRENAYRPRLERVMPEAVKKPAQRAGTPSVDETVAGLFNGSRIAADAFRKDVLLGALKLFKGTSEAEVAAELGKLYRRVSEETRRSDTNIGTGLPGPHELLRRYIAWLSEQNWLTNKKPAIIFRFDGNVFGGFREEEARLDPLGRDPITGRSA